MNSKVLSGGCFKANIQRMCLNNNMPIARAKGYKAKADALFSKIVRSKGKCERCGGTQWLQTAHIISRRYSATRCDINNAWCLDAKCHRRLTDFPYEHAEFITQMMGPDEYEALRLKAETPTKVDWKEVYEELKTVARERGIQ